ncbi:MAG: HD domain-containing protein [Planctomycetota bacterium]
MRPLEVIGRHYDASSPLYEILVVHSVLVAAKAAEIAERHLERRPGTRIDLEFLAEAALLHDVGIKFCEGEGLPSEGREPYVRHGVLGAELLREEGLPRHALVCERHVGAGISREEVIRKGLPLEPKDYLPTSAEEKIVCAADKFFSKDPGRIWREKPLAKIEKSLGKYGDEVLARWRSLAREFLEP